MEYCSTFKGRRSRRTRQRGRAWETRPRRAKLARHRRTRPVGYRVSEGPTEVRITETESRRAGARAWGRGNKEFMFTGDRVSVLPDDRVWRGMGLTAAQRRKYASRRWTGHLKGVKTVNAALCVFCHILRPIHPAQAPTSTDREREGAGSLGDFSILGSEFSFTAFSNYFSFFEDFFKFLCWKISNRKANEMCLMDTYIPSTVLQEWLYWPSVVDLSRCICMFVQIRFVLIKYSEGVLHTSWRFAHRRSSVYLWNTDISCNIT